MFVSVDWRWPVQGLRARPCLRPPELRACGDYKLRTRHATDLRGFTWIRLKQRIRNREISVKIRVIRGVISFPQDSPEADCRGAPNPRGWRQSTSACRHSKSGMN